ncbi:hypothetical protein OG512_06000 [Streptomyces sp. NBC_01378]
MKALRKAVRWSFAALVPGELALVLGLASGVRPPQPPDRQWRSRRSRS